MSNSLSDIFETIYKRDLWNMGQNESKSGLGSTLLFTESICENLPKIIDKYSISSMIDVSCGDWNWMKTIKDKLNCNYIGLDIVKDNIDNNNALYGSNHITFKCTDMLSYLQNLSDKSVDLIICRHTLEHLPTEYIFKCLNEFIRVSKYCLITTHKLCNYNREVELTITPYRPVNLELDPYSNILQKYYIDCIYDGPMNHIREEMYINLYKFI
jgi:ubiquinone/menaquinone biosynthesis C-methylase UbiE